MTVLVENAWTGLDNDMMAFGCKQKLRLNFECVFGTFNFTYLVCLQAYV